eukprot:GEMP01041219.1.p1 GENE.GEMP01041219.1~~GEMP01041219.1.p1  ORF type:complete len:428 (+),score=97.94 GEMP01041219.1:138-1421(+)
MASTESEKAPASTTLVSHIQTVHSSEANVEELADHIRITFRRPPCRFTLLSWNCSQLKPTKSFGSILERLHPDILCVQRLDAKIAQTIDKALPSHSRTKEEMMKGWGTNCQIYWSQWFEMEKYGDEVLPSGASLFYVQLRDRTSATGRFIVASLFSPGTVDFKKNQDCLTRICRGMPLLICFTVEDAHDAFASLKRSGLRDCFSSLGLPLRPTYPQRPAVNPDADQVLDYVCHLHGSSGQMRPMLALVLENITAEEGPPATMHMPISVCYELLPPPDKGMQGWKQTRPPAEARHLPVAPKLTERPNMSRTQPSPTHKSSSRSRTSLTSVDEDSETGDVILAVSDRHRRAGPSDEKEKKEQYGYGSFYGVNLGGIMGDYFGFGPKAPNAPSSPANASNTPSSPANASNAPSSPSKASNAPSSPSKAKN